MCGEIRNILCGNNKIPMRIKCEGIESETIKATEKRFILKMLEEKNYMTEFRCGEAVTYKLEDDSFIKHT